MKCIPEKNLFVFDPGYADYLLLKLHCLGVMLLGRRNEHIPVFLLLVEFGVDHLPRESTCRSAYRLCTNRVFHH